MKTTIDLLPAQNRFDQLPASKGFGGSSRPGLISLATLFSVLCPLSSLFAQGALAPPGAPTPTMKSLDQIQPRIDLQNAPASAVDTTNAAYQFIINQPGSYYLSANLATAKTNAIEINTADVTLDLNGFKISRASGSGGYGIEIPAPAHHAAILNGSITGFAYGIISDLATERAHGCIFSHLGVGGCSSGGIVGGYAAIVESCVVHDDTGGTAIFASRGSVLNNCAAIDNNGDYAIQANAASTLTNCAAYGNTALQYAIYGLAGTSLNNCAAYNNTTGTAILVGTGSSLINCSAWSNVAGTGIFASPGSTLTGCTASENTSSDANSYGFYTNGNCTLVGCTAHANTSTSGSAGTLNSVGIYAGPDSTLKNCTATSNKGDGIHTAQRANIIDCTGNSNGTGATGSGIVTDIRSVVRHCSASDNQKSGMIVLGASVVFENTVDHNGVGAAAAGIDASGGAGSSRIEGNHARDNNGIGILTSGPPGDVVIRNSVGGGVTITPYFPSSGPNFGLIQTPNNATNPMANIVF